MVFRAVLRHVEQAVHVQAADIGLLGGRERLIGLVMLDHPLTGNHVLPAVEQDALRPFAVAACAARLLVVGLH